MPSPPAAADAFGISAEKKVGARLLEWLLNPDHFHFKLLAGSSAGVVVIAGVAVAYYMTSSAHQRRERLRAEALEVIRVAGVVENDVAALENACRGRLLTTNGTYLEDFARLKNRFERSSEELSQLAVPNEEQAEFQKARNNIHNWLTANSQPNLAGATLSFPAILEAQKILQAILREEQIKLNQEMGDWEWAARSTQILSFIPDLKRAVFNMQKEKRAYLLTGDSASLEAFSRAIADFHTFEGYLSVLVANNPAHLEQLNIVRDQLEGWISQSAEPQIEAKRLRGDWHLAGEAAARRSSALMLGVYQAMERFEVEQADLYKERVRAAEHKRILQLWLVNFFCGLAGFLMIACSGYNFVLYQRQLQRLRGTDGRIRAVLDHIFDGMITIDEAGIVASMNPAAERLFGYKGGSSLRLPVTKLIPQFFEREVDEAPIACEWIQLAQRRGATTLALGETRARATFPIELSLTEFTQNQQRFYVAIIRDTTERKRFEDDLAAEKNSLAVTLASIGDGVITTDLRGQILILNQAAEAMTGWRAADAVGKPFRTVFLISENLAQTRNSGSGYRSEAEAILVGTPQRASIRSLDGRERLIEQVASPIRDAKNELCGVVVVFRDVTERERDEAERRKAEALDQLGLLAGGIAHDFNNLLTAIMGNISLVSMLLPPNDEMKGRLEDAHNASLRARDLAQQLLTFARGGAPIKQTASIADLVEETVRFSLRGSHVRSAVAISPDLWTAEFDPGQISQVIANLVVNADQAMPDGGTLHVSCDNFSYAPEQSEVGLDLPTGDYIRIQIRDEGTGIPADYLKRIFDPYFTTKAKGNGLGLATCYSVVRNHSGLVTVESELHCGSTFTVYLPAGRSPTVKAEEEALSPLSSELVHGSGRVLVVDDEEAIRLLVEFTLTQIGYEVTTADNSLQGIDLYRRALASGMRFDLVILDLTLPGGMGGKEALRKLIEIDPMVNAIVSSGYAMDATMSRYQDFGFRGMIAKPYHAAELASKVREMIEAERHPHPVACELQQAC
jgi:two-component system cell cycle sensor histidine kinase/response regulator CckA